MKSVELQKVDLEYKMHKQAFLTLAVRAEKGRGKSARPKYQKFDQFFNYQKEVDRVLNPEDKKEPKAIKRLRDYYKKKGGIPNG